MQIGIVEERITFTNDDGLQLAGVLAYPEQAKPKHAVLLCSPHPHFAGNMDNNVICAIARGLAEHAVTLRFDYRGVGESQIDLPDGLSIFDYWNDVEQMKNYTDAVRDVSVAARTLMSATKELDIPFFLIGYSFGAVTGLLYGYEQQNVCNMVAIAPPLGKVSFEFLSNSVKSSLFMIGTSDFLYSSEKVEELRQTLVSNAAVVEILEDVDHFFRGDEDMIAQKVDEFICNHMISSSRRISNAKG
jgi:alpha/beta superfamily hydrolase